MTTKFIFLLLLITILHTTPTSSQSNPTAEEITKTAIQHAKSGKNTKKALNLFRQAIELSPKTAKYHVNLGQLILNTMIEDASTFKQKYILLRKAIKYFQKAIKLQPKYKRAEKNLLKAKLREKKLKKEQKIHNQPKQKFKLTIPRVTMAELARNKTLLSGHWPYVITDAMKGWDAMDKWNDGDGLDYLESILKDEWVDFYSENMYSLGNKPILYRFSQANERWKTPKARDRGQPRYMQFRLSLPGWLDLKEDLRVTNEANSVAAKQALNGAGTADGRYLPNSMWTEDDWIDKCLDDEKDIDNFFRVNQWNMLLIGEVGTGIFFHHDHLASASWQAHVVGRKEWITCTYDSSKYIGRAGGVDPFKPNYDKYPNYHKAYCGKTTAGPGDLFYYPAYWWHTTKCLDRPTIGITGLMVGTEANRQDIPMQVHERFLKDLEHKCSQCWDESCQDESCRKCDDISKKWPGAAPPIGKNVCNQLNKCFNEWDKHYKSIGFENVGDEVEVNMEDWERQHKASL